MGQNVTATYSGMQIILPVLAMLISTFFPYRKSCLTLKENCFWAEK